MMEALTGDERFTEQIEELSARKAEKEEVYMCEYIDMLEARGKQIGEQIGVKKGENRLAELIGRLCKEGKYQEIEAVSADRQKRQELYQQYNII